MTKTWFITGASSGFGKELVQAVLSKGDNVAATFRQQEQATSFSEQNRENGLGIVMDVTNEEQIKSGIQSALATFGHIDVVVNNAGYGTIGAIEEFSLEEIRAQMDTNFFGAVAVTKEFLPVMRQQRSGHIVQISSQAGFRAAAGFGVYNASKFALEGFSEALAQEVAPFGLKVTIVEPGPFRTEFLAGSMKAAQQKIEAYQSTPVGGMYKYVESQNGKQEGDPVKAAQAIVDYVYSENKALRLPLGKAPVQAIRMKIAQVEADLKANEAIAVSTVYEV
ncbi:MAG TPA: oxidoreductase [Flavisolibacter sp.]|jgi:NAD(P)-dependent dehydrogenase (short-subunit alcohol dehydrogenase family)|nr:oxidoreductase [Flavisolibacter sp.]